MDQPFYSMNLRENPWIQIEHVYVNINVCLFVCEELVSEIIFVSPDSKMKLKEYSRLQVKLNHLWRSINLDLSFLFL